MRLLITLSLLIIGMNIQAQKVYLAENGVTVKASSDAVAGDIVEIKGDTFLIVDDAMLTFFKNNNIELSQIASSIVTTLVTDMNSMFLGSSAFNQDISSWDVSNVTDMSDMFAAAINFNQDISSWDVGQVTNMVGMFAQASTFNQDISSWDVSQVSIMRGMFNGATAFNQNLSKWNVGKVNNCIYFNEKSALVSAHLPKFTNCNPNAN